MFQAVTALWLLVATVYWCPAVTANTFRPNSKQTLPLKRYDDTKVGECESVVATERGAGRRVASDSRGGFRGRGQRPRPPRRRARQCQGRCSRGQLTSGDARGTRRRPRAAVDSRPAAETHALRHTRAINRSRRRQRALLRRRAVLTSQVPEVARAAAATAPASRTSPVAQPPHAHCTSSGALVMMVPGACWSTLTVSAVVVGRVGCVDTWCGARGQGEEVSSRAARRQRLR
ncbi:unnamed protein product [Spodoptera exigua]|nr:unnamed protein product [Spodoptera exigua]